ncbi:leucyl aminopeptidase [Yoonia sp.]|uniref:leucyl aminopeptidase n=1 Tax=Yoonia sp. TaxID=2212373 RepID=UPI00238A2EF4|nr:leucyl aminopeptidase [Yoonia sp.]MDE0849796.1 leucyl aminopeptidase [Yoonia sp.]
MTTPTPVVFTANSLEDLAARHGKVAVFVTEDGKMDQGCRKVNTLTRKTITRVSESDAFEKAKTGDVTSVAMPTGLVAEALLVVKLPRRPTSQEARKAGANLAKQLGGNGMLVLAGSTYRAEEVAQGIAMRTYNYVAHKTGETAETGAVTFMVNDPDNVAAAYGPISAIVEGVFFTRDLTNAPANDLTTTSFADQLAALSTLGLKVEVLEEPDLEKLGMGSLLCVGQGSDSPSKVVVMQWNGGGDEAPFALVGKGVVFDTGGISLKPGAGMEDMTMDMGGAGVVSGVMKTLALRKAKANVVGIVGIVENMPSGNAVRPGDVVKSMKGDTIEVINTDAEGRLVLADVLWYTQERFKPVGMINLATLTGAILVALGHENAGVFSNSDDLSGAFIKAAGEEGEGAWRMPMSPAYDALIKSRIADMKNVGGRMAGSITAAQFLKRFVKDDVPWCHLDIAGTASVKSETALAPAGATGWGVMALNRLIADKYES